MTRNSTAVSISIHPLKTTFKKLEEKINELEQLFDDIADEIVLSKEHGRNHKKPTHFQIGLSLRKPIRVDNIRRKFMGWLKTSNIEISQAEQKNAFKFKSHKNKHRLFMYCLKEKPKYYYIKSLGGVMNKEYLDEFIQEHLPYAIEYGINKPVNDKVAPATLSQILRNKKSLKSYDEYVYDEWLKNNPNDPVYQKIN